ncbi:MAG: diguanylate cyclase [Blastocatellia bacterium]
MLRQLYQTYWFYVLCLLAAAIVAGSYRLRISQSKRRREAQNAGLLRERLRLLEQHTCMLEQENQDLRRLSYLDGLTGIANRRHFEEALDLEWRRACRAGTALSLVMIDADFFKPFNDAYGHQRGDDCLIRIANTLRNGLNRPGDMAARYGGDEFILLIPGSDARGVAELAEAVRARIAAMEISHEGSPADKVVTISLGAVTGYPTRGFSSGDLIVAADEALYRAKEDGRNQVAIIEEPIWKIEKNRPSPVSDLRR